MPLRFLEMDLFGHNSVYVIEDQFKSDLRYEPGQGKWWNWINSK
jgi:hypothetical protein